MTARFVIAYFADRESDATLAALRAAGAGEVIAVALDLGAGVPLAVQRDAALAAGALRCHAFDAREAFYRQVVLPALGARGGDGRAETRARATAFVIDRLREVAAIEHAEVIAPELVDVTLAAAARREGSRAEGLARLDIRFADRVPIAVNDVPMTVTEVMDCLETIARAPAVDVLQLAYETLDGASDGEVALQAERGQVTAAPVMAVA